MQKITLNKLNAAQMHVISNLLKYQVENPVYFEVNFRKGFDFANPAPFMRFISNQVLIDLFRKKFNKAAFKQKYYTVSLTHVEAVIFLRLILFSEKYISDDLDYRKVVFTELKTRLHKSLAGLPTYENLPF